MGAYLSEPITNKETSVEENEEVRVASSSMQGWRVSQEVRTGIFKSYEDMKEIKIDFLLKFRHRLTHLFI